VSEGFSDKPHRQLATGVRSFTLRFGPIERGERREQQRSW
jgi:hypothetical protein